MDEQGLGEGPRWSRLDVGSSNDVVLFLYVPSSIASDHGLLTSIEGAPYQPYRYAHINHRESLAYILNVLKRPEYLPPSNAECFPYTIPEVIAAWEPAVQ